MIGALERLRPAATIGVILLGACSPVEQARNLASAGGALVNSVTATEQPSLAPLELRRLQTREFAAPKPAAFAGVMTVLLDMGYRVQSADVDSGLITAIAPSSARLRLDPTGVARATQTPVASVFVEQLQPSASRVRLNLSVGTTTGGAAGGTGERPVLDEGLYASFFSQLDDELRTRQPPDALEAREQPRTDAPAIGSAEAGPDDPRPAADEPALEDEASAELAPTESGTAANEPDPDVEPIELWFEG